MRNKYDFLNNKIVDLTGIQRLIKIWELAGEQIVFTNGCFDILHPGHIAVLTTAAEQGNKLIVGLNTDASVKRLKGPQRPINHQDARATVLSALAFVDAIILFDEDTPKALIEALQPDVLVKGGDYKLDQIVGADVVHAKGGKVIIVPTLEGNSTTGMIAKILEK